MASGPKKTRRRLAWQAAMVMGLVSGTYSTVLITLGAPRIGRSRAIDWMDIGTVLLGLDGLRTDPGIREIAAGVAVHQSADLAWAIALFALGRRWTLGLTSRALLIIALPWAVLTSAIEYYLLLPTLQPLVPLQVPYWTALMVHVTSAVAYPLFPWIRSRLAGAPDLRAAQWAKATSIVLTVIVTPAAAVEVLGGTDHEPRWPFVSAATREFDERFMQEMVMHHDAGVEIARLALAKGLHRETSALAQLIVAEQTREAALLRNWWRSWFNRSMPASSSAESDVPGMPSAQDLQRFLTLPVQETERAFLMLMREHHRGAVQMTDEAWTRAGDPRLRAFAQSVRHAQSGQIRWITALMTVDSPSLPRRPSVVDD